MRKNKKVLALILSMVNVLGLSKSNANPKGESKKDAVVNESKDKNGSGSENFRSDESKNKLKRIFSEYNLVTKRNVLDLLLVAFGGGYIYKHMKPVDCLLYQGDADKNPLLAGKFFSHADHVLKGVQRILEILISAQDEFGSNQSVVTENTGHFGYFEEGLPTI